MSGGWFPCCNQHRILFGNLIADCGFKGKSMKYGNDYPEETNNTYTPLLNSDYLSKHPEIESFNMPKNFYFRYLPDRIQIHWAVIKQEGERVFVYFINKYGRAFDKLEFNNIKIARRRLRKCGFDFSTNRHCYKSPWEPIYIQLSNGRKSAPYSKGNLLQSVQRDGKHPYKCREAYEKAFINSIMSLGKRRKRRNLKTILQDLHDFIFDNPIIRLVHFISYVKKGLKENKEYFKKIEAERKRKIPLLEKICIVIRSDVWT